MSRQIGEVRDSSKVRYLSLPIPAVELNGTLYVNSYCAD